MSLANSTVIILWAALGVIVGLIFGPLAYQSFCAYRQHRRWFKGRIT